MAKEHEPTPTREAGLGVLLLVVVAAGGLSLAQRGGPAANGAAGKAASDGMPTPAAAERESKTQPSACGLGVKCVLGSYLGADPTKPPSPWEQTCRNLEYLVFLVPDPIDAHVGWQFDADLEAIQRAAEANRYALDRFVLPWDAGAVKRAACAAANGGDQKECGSRDAHQTQPGVLLFRQDRYEAPPRGATPALANEDDAEPEDPGRPLVVFLVGETPTGGIQKAALAAALDEIAACRDDQIRIVGPTFSGSTRSLVLALKEWWGRRRDWQAKQRDWRLATKPTRSRRTPIRIVSGTATGVPVEEFTRVGRTPDGHDAVSFSATVIPDAVVFDLFVRGYLQDDLGVPPRQIALLVEANTAYGQNLPTGGGTLTLSFPMHIAGARSALEKTRNKGNGEGLAVARPQIQMKLDDTREPVDLPPQMYPGITGPSAEFVLANILATISRNDIRYVGLMASDARDKIFLAGQIKKYCRDVRLFTFEGDLLYAHPEFRDTLSGMLVASTYPLFNRTQAWTAPSFKQLPSRRLQFPNSAAQGIYNAALVQLGYKADYLMADYAMPRNYWGNGSRTPCSTACNPSWKYCWCQEPVLWISAVGNGGLWPIGVEQLPAERSYVWTGSRELKQVDVPKPESGSATSAVIFWSVLSVFCLAQVVRYLAATRFARAAGGTRRSDRVVAWLQSDLYVRRRGRQREQGAYVLVCFGALAGFYSFVSVYFWAQPASTYGAAPWVILVGLVALSVVVVDAVDAVAPRRVQSTVRYLRISVPAAVAVTLLMLTLGAPYWDSALAIPGNWKISIDWWKVQTMLAYERATNLESQLSPVVPGALVAGVWFLWGRCHLRRLALLEDHAVQCVLGGDAGVRERGISAAYCPIHIALVRPFSRPLALAAWLWLPPCLVVGMSFLPTFEPRVFDFFFEAAFLLASVMVVISFAQAFSLWWHVRWLLERLAAHPILAASEHLAPILKQRVREAWYAFTPALADFERAVAGARRLVSGLRDAEITPIARAVGVEEEAVRRLRGALEHEVAAAEGELTAAVTAGRKGLTAARYRQLQNRLDGAAVLVAAVLRREWDQTEAGEAPAQNAAPIVSWRAGANELVAFQSLTYLGQLFAHLRNLLTFATAGLLLLLLAVPSYPFEPEHLLGLLVWALVFAVVGGVVMAVVQMNRSEVLSKLAGTPHTLSFDRTLVAPVLKFGAIPILSLLATQLPGIGESLFSWLEPALRTLK